MSRIIKKSIIKGVFGLPIGISFRNREPGAHVKMVLVSTVNLEGGHLEDPLTICSPEHGFETMIFLDGCTFFSIYTVNYKTRLEAEEGHDSIVRKLCSSELKLAIPLHYNAWVEEEATA